MSTPEEISGRIIDKLLHGTYGANPRFDFDERRALFDELVAALQSYGAARATAERERCVNAVAEHAIMWLPYTAAFNALTAAVAAIRALDT